MQAGTRKQVGLKNCLVCQAPVPHERFRRGTKTCSNDCATRRDASQYAQLEGRYPLSSGTLGALRELMVAVDLTTKGFEIFRALSPAAPCDLIALKDGHLLRVEVASAYKRVGSDVSWPKRKHPHDVMAAVVGKDIYYRGLPD